MTTMSKYTLSEILECVHPEDSIQDLGQRLRQIAERSEPEDFFGALALYFLMNENTKSVSPERLKKIAAEMERLLKRL